MLSRDRRYDSFPDSFPGRQPDGPRARAAVWRRGISGAGNRLGVHSLERMRAGWLVAAVMTMIATGLAGCTGGTGFRPMYAASAGGPNLSDKMAQISVTTVPGRVGQKLRNELIFQTTGGGEAVEKAYKLDIILRERLTSQLVNVVGNAESQIYHLDADFQLTDNRSKKVLLKGQSFGRAGFQRFQTIYSNVRAKIDAEDRAARTIALDMRGRIEAFLSR